MSSIPARDNLYTLVSNDRQPTTPAPPQMRADDRLASPRLRLPSTVYRLPMFILTLVAFALRLYRLGYPSLRGDEAFDVLFASQSLHELFYQFRFVQPYPPLFHVGLHFWLGLAGTSEFAVRFWAALASTLAVPAVYALGAQLFDRRVGTVGALLAAVNPFLHWWGQDAHFYAYLAALATILNVVALRFWRRQATHRVPFGKAWTPIPWIGTLYVPITLISFLTHYFAYFTWGALNVIAGLQTLRQRWPRSLMRHWWSVQAVLIILYLPWVIFTFPITSTYVEAWIEPATPWNMLWRDVNAFSVGYSSPLSAQGINADPTSAGALPWLAGFFAALSLAGIVVGWLDRAYRPGLIRTLTLIGVPLVAIYLASFHRPIFDEKLTIFLLPLYLLLLSLGIVKLAQRRRWAGALAGLAVFAIMGFANYQYFTDESLAKSPAWREMLHFVHEKAQPGDLLVYNFPDPSILHYNAGKLPSALIPDSAGLSADQIAAQVEGAIAGRTRVWLVPLVKPWWDARGDTITWLERHGDRLDQRFFRGAHVSLYLTPAGWQPAMHAQPVEFAQGIRLQGSRLAVGATLARPGLPPSGVAARAGVVARATVSPGDTLRVSLYWQADSPTAIPYTVFTHLVGPDGQLYGQWDNPPVRGTYPTTEWRPGEQVVDQYEIAVDPAAPPGEYRLLVGLYDPGTGIRLPVLNDDGQPAGDHVRLEKPVWIE